MITPENLCRIIHDDMVIHARETGLPFGEIPFWETLQDNLKTHAREMFWRRLRDWHSGIDARRIYNDYRVHMHDAGWMQGDKFDDKKKIHPRIGIPWEAMSKPDQLLSDIIISNYRLYIPKLRTSNERVINYIGHVNTIFQK